MSWGDRGLVVGLEAWCVGDKYIIARGGNVEGSFDDLFLRTWRKVRSFKIGCDDRLSGGAEGVSWY